MMPGSLLSCLFSKPMIQSSCFSQRRTNQGALQLKYVICETPHYVCIVLRNFPGGDCQVAAGGQVATCIVKVRLGKFPLSWDVHGQHCRVKCCFTSSEPAFNAVSQSCKVPVTESPGCSSCVSCSHPPHSTCFRSVINGWLEGQILHGI